MFLFEKVPDKRVLNLLIVATITWLTFSWTFWIFHQSINWLVIISAITCRVVSSVLIFNDYSLSWSKVTPKTFILKSIVYAIPLVFYIPPFYGDVRIALFLSEFAFFLLAINFLVYGYAWYNNRSKIKPTKTLVIYGAGSGGMKLLEEYKNSSYRVQFFIDDDKKLQKRSVDGIKIISIDKAKKFLDKNKLDLLIIAMPSIPKQNIAFLYEQMREYFLHVKILPPLSEILQDKSFSNQLKSITIEDLLARNTQDLDKNAIESFLKQKTVFVTGAGGSIGSEICRQCVKHGAKIIYALDHSEYNLYTLKEELGEKITPIMTSVLNKKVLEATIASKDIDIFIHAAAYKHVPLVEENIHEAIENNIIGTKNCIDLAGAHGVKKFILISTDKAVRPTNVMGATKRICELYAANKQTDSMEIVAVRFGNVLGSSGSVIPKFYKQIGQGGPITITHPEITRYFMLISEACELVLQSGAIGKGGEIFILDMGEPVKIVDLAKKMIELSGNSDIAIEFIGLRPGEKLYEELLISKSDLKTKYPSILISVNTSYDIEKLTRQISELLETTDKVKKLKEIVPEFNHQLN